MNNKDIDLFDPEYEMIAKQRSYKTVFRDQDEMALKSEVFKRILQSEIKEDPDERFESTNNPKAKTRNALLSRGEYQTQEEWEQNLLTNPFYSLKESKMKFDDAINELLSEKFGAPGKARSRQSIGGTLTSRDPNLWKDPLKKHAMKDVRGQNRKKPGWVPRTHQRELAIPMAQRILDIAKDADEGIWKISKAQAVSLATKYRMHLPNDKTPAKRLGSTGIVMWRKVKDVPEPEIFLVKHEQLLRSGLSKKKKVMKLGSKKKKGREVFKGSFKSTFKAKKPKKPKGPTFDPGKVGT